MGEYRVCLPDPALESPWTLASYESTGGYEAWRRIVAEGTTAEEIIETSRIRACAGAAAPAFPRA